MCVLYAVTFVQLPLRYLSDLNILFQRNVCTHTKGEIHTLSPSPFSKGQESVHMMCKKLERARKQCRFPPILPLAMLFELCCQHCQNWVRSLGKIFKPTFAWLSLKFKQAHTFLEGAKQKVLEESCSLPVSLTSACSMVTTRLTSLRAPETADPCAFRIWEWNRSLGESFPQQTDVPYQCLVPKLM